jgi:hypothetical protein
MPEQGVPPHELAGLRGECDDPFGSREVALARLEGAIVEYAISACGPKTI